MTVENANYISELNPAWPLDSDLAQEGNDHIQTTKRAVQQSFPNINSEVSATPAQINSWEERLSALEAGPNQAWYDAILPVGTYHLSTTGTPPTIPSGVTATWTRSQTTRYLRGSDTSSGGNTGGQVAPLTSTESAGSSVTVQSGSGVTVAGWPTGHQHSLAQEPAWLDAMIFVRTA